MESARSQETALLLILVQLISSLQPSVKSADLDTMSIAATQIPRGVADSREQYCEI